MELLRGGGSGCDVGQAWGGVNAFMRVDTLDSAE